ncbi:MAG: fused response regulator/phosphatase [Desulfamplus sp.]|nr:fused response regulator/phosphatase [Desulfamplus sp.]
MISPMKALVVDDNFQNRMLLKVILELDNFTIYEAENGLDAVNMFKEVNPDIVLMDVMMPVMDGYDATRRIKEHSGDKFVPVIVLTALNEPEDISKAIECGADDFLTKPIHALVLKSKIFAMERLRQLYHNLNLQKVELELLNSKMRQEQDAAADLFKKVLRLNEERAKGVRQIVLPMERFSGDIVFSRAKPSGGKYLIIGDFAGHGILAAIGTIPVAEIFNSMADADQPIESLIFEINKKLKELLPPAAFLCAAIVECTSNQRVVKVWSGGMPDIFVVNRDGLIEQKIKSCNLPLGIINSIKCEPEPFIFEIDDALYLFSDGVIETFNDKNEMYGQERLEAHFKSGAQSSQLNRYNPDTILEKIKQSIDDFRGNISQQDDISMVQLICL